MGSGLKVQMPPYYPVKLKDGVGATGVNENFLWVARNLATSNQNNFSMKTVSGDTTLGSNDLFVLVNCTSANITITLPAASNYEGKHYHIKKKDTTSYSVIVDGNGSDTIDGELTYEFDIPKVCISVVSDGTEWWIF
jgi:hypothetical protein